MDLYIHDVCICFSVESFLMVWFCVFSLRAQRALRMLMADMLSALKRCVLNYIE